MRFTRAEPGDPRLLALQLACLPYDEPRDFRTDAVWLGLEAGVPAAFCSVRMLDSGEWYLSRAGVLPEFRGKGLQKRMIRLRVAFARKHNPTRVVTDCTPDNYGSANSLMACGFRLFRPERKWSFSYSLYWALTL